MPTSSTFTIKVNDTQPLTFTLTVDGVAQDLTGASAVVMTMRQLNAATPFVSKPPVTVTNATAGQCSFAWPAGATATGMVLECEVTVTFANGSQLTFPNDMKGQPGTIEARIA